ncbi:MAG: MFS transporter [Promethearchaeota archaeon]
MTSESTGKLSGKNLWGYALGAVPTALLGFVFTLKYVEFFYNELKLLPIYFIIGQIIYMTINALNDPLSGQLSDRTNREKWGGRRIVYIKYGGPIWVATFLLVWFPWSFENQFIIFIHFIISICLFDTMLTLVVLCWLALLPEMTEDIDERNKAHFLSGILGVFAVIPLFLILADMNPTTETFQIFMIFIAIISTIFLLLVAYMCEERPEFVKDETFPLGKSLKEAFKSKTFVIYIPFYFCMNLLGSLALSYLFIYLMLLERTSTGAILLFFLIYFIIGFGSQVVCMMLRPKWGMRKIILVFGTFRVIGTIILFIIILNPSYEYLIWFGLIWITFFGGYGIFHIPMQYLAIDEDEIKNGTRREGMFMGIMALLTKPATSLGPIIATIILVSYGYIQGAPASEQPESVFIGIKILMLLIPAIIAGISLIPIYFYPLYGEKLEEMQRKLEIMHKQKREIKKEKAWWSS